MKETPFCPEGQRIEAAIDDHVNTCATCSAAVEHDRFYEGDACPGGVRLSGLEFDHLNSCEVCAVAEEENKFTAAELGEELLRKQGKWPPQGT
jgi:hypothetical protein